MPPITPLTSVNPQPGQPTYVSKQPAPPPTQPPPPSGNVPIITYGSGQEKPLVVRNRFTGEVKAVYGQSAQRSLDTGTWQPYGGQVYWRTTTPGERQADIVAAGREKIQTGLESAASAYSAGQPVSAFYQRGFELPTSTLFTKTTTTAPASAQPEAQPTYQPPQTTGLKPIFVEGKPNIELFEQAKAQAPETFYSPKYGTMIKATDQQETLKPSTERIISPSSVSFYTGSQKVSDVIGKWESIADVGAMRITGKLPSIFKPIYTGAYQLGRGIFLEAPKSTVETVGMLPGGVETIAKKPALLPTFAITGTSQMISSTATSFKERPLETIGTTIGTAAIFSGVGKGIGKGIEIAKPSLSTVATSFSEGVKLFREGQTVKVPTSFSVYPYPSTRVGEISAVVFKPMKSIEKSAGEIHAAKVYQDYLKSAAGKTFPVYESRTPTDYAARFRAEEARLSKQTQIQVGKGGLTQIVGMQEPVMKTSYRIPESRYVPFAKTEYSVPHQYGASRYARYGAAQKVRIIKPIESIKEKPFAGTEYEKTIEIPKPKAKQMSVVEQMSITKQRSFMRDIQKYGVVSVGTTIGIAASISKGAAVQTPVEQAIQRQKEIAKSVQVEQAALIPTSIQITPTISIPKSATPQIAIATAISPQITTPKITPQETLRIEPTFRDGGGRIRKKLKFQFPSITTETLFRKRKRKTTKGFGKFPELARIATARQIIGGTSNLKFKAQRMSYKPPKRAVNMKLPSFKLASLTKSKKKSAKRRRR